MQTTHANTPYNDITTVAAVKGNKDELNYLHSKQRNIAEILLLTLFRPSAMREPCSLCDCDCVWALTVICSAVYRMLHTHSSAKVVLLFVRKQSKLRISWTWTWKWATVIEEKEIEFTKSEKDETTEKHQQQPTTTAPMTKRKEY